jgi:hypothetical protein
MLIAARSDGEQVCLRWAAGQRSDRSGGKAIEFVGDLGVRPERRSCPMPGASIGVPLVFQRCGKSGVRGSTIDEACALVDSRPYERMTKVTSRSVL